MEWFNFPAFLMFRLKITTKMRIYYSHIDGRVLLQYSAQVGTGLNAFEGRTSMSDGELDDLITSCLTAREERELVKQEELDRDQINMFGGASA